MPDDPRNALRSLLSLAGTPWWNDLDALLRRSGARPGEGLLSPRADIVETDDAYLVDLELPGVRAEAVSVDLAADVLSVRGEKSDQHREGGGRRLAERRFGTFERSFTFPSPVSSEGVEARLDDGVLRVRVPKAKESKTTRVQVRSR